MIGEIICLILFPNILIAVSKHAESVKVLHSEYPYTSHLDFVILLALPMYPSTSQSTNLSYFSDAF